MNNNLFVVCAVHEKHKVKLRNLGIKQNSKLTWADGMIGILPIFDDKVKAEKFADGKFEIMTVIIKK